MVMSSESIAFDLITTTTHLSVCPPCMWRALVGPAGSAAGVTSFVDQETVNERKNLANK